MNPRLVSTGLPYNLEKRGKSRRDGEFEKEIKDYNVDLFSVSITHRQNLDLDGEVGVRSKFRGHLVPHKTFYTGLTHI